MKRIIAGFGLLIGLGVNAQSTEMQSMAVRTVLDSSITLMRTYALNRHRPDWDYVRERAYELAGKASRPGGAMQLNDLGPAISWLFEAVDDYDGCLVVGDTTFRWQRAEQPFLSAAVKNELKKDDRIIRTTLPGRIAYLRVPGMGNGLLDSLHALEADGARKLIIDLRLSAGESMPAMTPGLSPLLDDERIPVVILTGHGTGRAGECIAVAFKGRKHTVFMGEPTAGHTTRCNGHEIVDGKIKIFMAESMLTDRKRRSYPHNLIPDEWVPGGDDFSDLSNDKKVQAAINWLKGR